MPYLAPNGFEAGAAGARLRQLLLEPGILRLPGVHNGLASLQARNAGFSALYLSGAAMSASMGLPDLGLLSVEDVAFFIRQIVRASDLPLLVDGDTGYGETLNVMHMVRVFEECGAAGVHLEDQVMPKKCGHLGGKRLVTAAEMAAKIAAAVRARRHLFVVARTDAVAVDGFEAAVARARTYLEAGADAIFPEALESLEMFRAFRRALPDVPLLANMTEFGKGPVLSSATLEAMGYAMVIWPVSSMRVAARAQATLYATLARDGEATEMLDAMQSRSELYDLIDLSAYETLDTSIARSILP